MRNALRQGAMDWAVIWYIHTAVIVCLLMKIGCIQQDETGGLLSRSHCRNILSRKISLIFYYSADSNIRNVKFDPTDTTIEENCSLHHP